jgi:hypothetical protein
MEMLELLKEHPKTATVIKQWLLDKLLESMKDQTVPEEFKQYAREQGIDNERVAGILANNPRSLFDVFDNHKIYVETTLDELGGFWWNIGETKSPVGYEYRKNCDGAAIVEAFKLLEAKI